jgi:hypothetical protein
MTLGGTRDDEAPAWLGAEDTAPEGVHVGSVDLRHTSRVSAQRVRAAVTRPFEPVSLSGQHRVSRVAQRARVCAHLHVGEGGHHEAAEPTPCSQHGYLSSRSGCHNRWHSLMNCDHGDSTTSRFDSPNAPSSEMTSSKAGSNHAIVHATSTISTATPRFSSREGGCCGSARLAGYESSSSHARHTARHTQTHAPSSSVCQLPEVNASTRWYQPSCGWSAGYTSYAIIDTPHAGARARGHLAAQEGHGVCNPGRRVRAPQLQVQRVE